jgi:hypothetical protein
MEGSEWRNCRWPSLPCPFKAGVLTTSSGARREAGRDRERE